LLHAAGELSSRADGEAAGPDKALLGAVATALWGKRVGPGLSDLAIAVVIQRRASRYRGRLRRAQPSHGFHHRRGRQGVCLPVLMAVTDQGSVTSVAGYVQQGGVRSNPAAR
jgi:hypothetical protein